MLGVKSISMRALGREFWLILGRPRGPLIVMSLAELSVKRPVFIVCIFLVILGLGILARSRMPSSLYPDVTFPIMNVIVPYPGAGPNEIAEQVSKPIETELNSLAGVRLVRSLSLDNAAVVTAVFSMDTDIRFAEQKVIQVMTRVRPQLPAGILEPTIRSVDPTETPVMTLSFSAALSEAELFDLADREIRPQLEQIEQVGQVDVIGARKREIQVELNLQRLKQIQMSAAEVVGRLSAAGLDIPAGQIGDHDRETLVRAVGRFESLNAIRATPIRQMGNTVISLGDIATVHEGLQDEKNRVTINGEKAVVLLLFRRSGANAVEASDQIRNRIKEINIDQSSKVKGFNLDILRDGARPVRDGIHDATEAIILGLILTIVVVFFFLGNVRSTVITGLALPNSILGAFFLMAIAGFTVNITTLAALALAVGLLIDDAIVVRENIFRHLESGEKPDIAAIKGTREVTLAVVATTLTVLSVFGPVSFLQGIIGQFFKQFGLTICFAMLISLLDSLTIAPMLSAYFGASREEGGVVQRLVAPFGRLQNYLQKMYASILEKTLRFPLRTLFSALVICAVSVVLLKYIPKAFVPSQEAGEFQVLFELPAGVTLDLSDRKLQEAAKKIREHKEVKQAIVTAGGDNGERNEGRILVLLTPPSERKRSTSTMKDVVREDIKDFTNVSTRVEDLLDVGGGAGHPFSMKITGENLADLKTVSGELIEKLKNKTDLKDLSRSYQPGAKEISWVIDSENAKKLAVSSGEVGNELRLLVAGAEPARLHEGSRDYPIHVRVKDSDLKKAFAEVSVPNLNHQLIPLSSVAHREETEAPAAIARENRKPFIEITAELSQSGKDLSSALRETSRLFDSGEVQLPAGVHYEFSGQTKDFQDLLSNMILAVVLSIIAMYLVLASLYESFFVPFSIMLVLPLAICGAFYGLWVTHSSLDIYSMIGCVLLMGVAAKNSILLVDSIRTGVLTGLAVPAAIKRAGNLRFRPIMMTSFALIAGMLPLALPLQESAKGRAPMAIAVIGGVISSTFLTLVVVPAAYGYIVRFEKWVRRA
jgi:hydrophobic/amphiphilic exporter-1 (mainly G- bacteria), HAE1 family